MTMTKHGKTTTDAVKILRKRHVKSDPKRLASLESEREKAAVAAQTYGLRTKVGLTQKQLTALLWGPPSRSSAAWKMRTTEAIPSACLSGSRHPSIAAWRLGFCRRRLDMPMRERMA